MGHRHPAGPAPFGQAGGGTGTPEHSGHQAKADAPEKRRRGRTQGRKTTRRRDRKEDEEGKETKMAGRRTKGR